MSNKLATEWLHGAFASMQPNTEFTPHELWRVAYNGAPEFDTKWHIKKVNTFVTKLKREGYVVNTDQKRAGATGREVIVRKKIKDLPPLKIRKRMNIIHPEWPLFLREWNKISFGISLTFRNFKEICHVTDELTSKRLSEFFNQLVYHGYAELTKDARGGSYRKKKNDLSEQTMKDKFFIVRTEKRETQPRKVITVDRNVAVRRPTIDPNNISAMDLRDAFVETTLADKETIRKLQAQIQSFDAIKERYRKASIEKVDELNKKVCVLEREKGVLERLIKNKDSTITSLKKAMNEKRDLVLKLREQLEAANHKLESHSSFKSFKLSDIQGD